MSKNIKTTIVILLSLFIVCFFLSIYLSIEEEIPGNAVVVVTLEDKLYHSIHFDYICLENKTAKTMTLSEAESAGFTPHQHCEDLGYFRGSRRFLFHHLLSKIGLTINSRWDRDGNWQW